MIDHQTLCRSAASSHGVLRPEYLEAAGVTPRQRQRLVRGGAWRRLPNGVLVLAGSPDTMAMRATAALVPLPHAALSHDTAGWAHGVEGVDEERLHLTVRTGSSSRSALATVHRSRLDRVDVTRRHGFPVTSLERTLVDLGATMPVRRLGRAIEGCLVERRTTFDRVESAYLRLGARGRNGCARTGSVLADLDGRPPSESELEAMFLDLLDRSGLPRPRAQVGIPGVTGEKGRVDFFYADAGLIVELDGRRFHARMAAFERDRRRDQAATRRGLRTLRFTHRQVAQEPNDVIDVLRDVLDR